MKTSKELSVQEVNYPYQPSDFPFNTISEIIPSNKNNQEDKLLDDLKKILEINCKGFNVYISGLDSKERENEVIKYIQKIASNKKELKVIGYIYNFKNPEEPMLLELDYKVAEDLEIDLGAVRSFVNIELIETNTNEELEKKKLIISNNFEDYKVSKLSEMEGVAISCNLELKLNEDKVVFIPRDSNGKNIAIEEYELLTLEEQEQIDDNMDKLYKLSQEIIEDINEYEKKSHQLISDLYDEATLKQIQRIICYFRDKYKDTASVIEYFEHIGEELIDNLQLFTIKDNINIVDQHYRVDAIQKITQKYYYNRLTTQDINKGAPVIIDEEYIQTSINGRMVINPEINAPGTMFKQFRPGLLHYSKDGYLIIHINKVARCIEVWEELKNTLIIGKIPINNIDEISTLMGISLRPERCQMNTKVILIGCEEVYNALYEGDPDFSALFKYHMHFDNIVGINKNTIQNIASEVSCYCKEEGIKEVEIKGFLKLIKIYQREYGLSNKIPLSTEFIMDILRISNNLADSIITENDILKAIGIKNNYAKYIVDKIDESYIDGTYLVDTRGEKIGQINGLAVYSVAGNSFGRPTKITATTYKGTSGIIDIEKQSNLSGEIHTKGVNILTGFLGKEFAQSHPLSLTCNICFEQNYGPIEGDSASVAELYAIISSLSELPILQNIAITGSMNQFGDIQPIGGVTQKIEGFFEVCKKRGIQGNEGVIIPSKNVKDLILNDEVIEAIKTGRFHIYTIEHVWEGAEIVLSCNYKKIYQLVNEKLTKFI